MRRVLSWIVLYILNFIFYIAEFYLWKLVFFLFGLLLDSSTLVFFLVLFLGGGEVLLGILYVGITYGCVGVVVASQKVWKSKSGQRYKVLGILNIIFFAACIFIVIFGGARGAGLALLILAYATMIVFGIGLIAFRENIVDEYGQPPTKREVLQAKLDKLDKEYCKYCGNRLAPGSEFCNKCGKKLD